MALSSLMQTALRHRGSVWSALAAGMAVAAFSVPIAAQPGIARPLSDARWRLLADRLYPNLERLGQNGLSTAPAARVLSDRRKRIGACNHVAACVLNASIWTPTEIALFADNVAKALDAKSSPAVNGVGIRDQIAHELQGINSVIGVFGLGGASEYPVTDGPVDAPGSPMFVSKVADAVLLGETAGDDPSSALDPSIAVALALLEANDHFDAVAFEPLDKTFNGPATAKARSIVWGQYQYTAIIVPGKGPDDPLTELSLRSELRCRLAARKFFEGAAPFIIVSGSSVHPRGTRFVEAIEMRKALIERFGVPADRVIVEPYARHTITNLRNAVRLLAGIGGPLDRDMLIVTDADQTNYIADAKFEVINQTHLGLQPGKVGERLSPTELTYRPSTLSLRLNPVDPLDP